MDLRKVFERSFLQKPIAAEKLKPFDYPFDIRDDQRVIIKICPNQLAKRLILRIDRKEGMAKMTVPMRTSHARIKSFLEKNQNWLETKLAELAILQDEFEIKDGALIEIHGKSYAIFHQETARQGVRLLEEEGKLLVSGGIEHLEARVYRFLKAEAKTTLSQKAKSYAARIDKIPTRIVIKDQKGRWGSCSSKGNLNFNWRLVMCPDFVQDYVVAHEVAHMRHMDHTPNFWRLVGELEPEYGKAKSWLTRNSTRLFAY